MKEKDISQWLLMRHSKNVIRGAHQDSTRTYSPEPTGVILLLGNSADPNVRRNM